MEKRKVTFRITIISLYFLLSLIMLGIVFFSMMYFDRTIVSSNIKNEFSSTETNAKKAISEVDKANSGILNLVSIYENVNKDFETADKSKLLRIFLKLFENNPKLYSAYIGYENGSFYELISLDISDSLRKKYGASPDDKWLVVTIFTESGKYLKKLELLNVTMEVTSSKIIPSDYDPRTRPWYKDAAASDTVIKTSPYTFSNFDGKGITYAMKLGRTRNVLAVDVITDSLNEMLNSYRFTDSTLVFLFGKSGDAYASSDNTSKASNLIQKEMETEAATMNTQTVHYAKTLGKKKYLIHINKITGPLGDINFIGMAAPYDEVLSIFQDRSYKIFYACAGTFILMIPLILYLVSLIVRPITMLKNESDKVSKREFNSIRKVKTQLMEIHQLSDSIYVMSKSIQDYQQNLEEKIEERTKELEEKNSQLEKLSVTDKLTDVFNRIKLDNVLETEIARSDRYATPLSIIILDIDHFKRVNDNYGHQTGDSVLVEFASILKSSVRITDTVGRWGGEEFLVICPETDTNGALSLAENIRIRLEAYSFKTVGKVTASIGIASFTKGDKEKDMIARADACLYKAKETGRNKSVCGQNF